MPKYGEVKYGKDWKYGIIKTIAQLFIAVFKHSSLDISTSKHSELTIGLARQSELTVGLAGGG